MANPTVTIEIREVGADKVLTKMKAVRQEAGKLTAAKKQVSKGAKETKTDMGHLAVAMSRVVSSNKLAKSSLSQVGERMQAVTGNTKLAATGMKNLGSQMQRVISSNKLAGQSFSDLGRRMEIMMRSKRLDERITRRQALASRKLSQQTAKTAASFARGGRRVSRFADVMKDLETNAVLALGPLSGVGARVRAIGVLARRGNIGIIAFTTGIVSMLGAATLLVVGLFKARKALESIESRFMAVTGSVLATKAGMEDALSVARRFGVDFKAAADGLSQLAAAARGTILQGEGIRRVFEGASAAVGALRLGIVQSQGIFKALEQIMTKGVVRAEELNQQLGDQLPGAAKIMASALGIGTQKLQEMLKAGELMAEEVLPKFAEELIELFGPQAAAGADSLQGALNRVSTELTIFFDVLETRVGIVAFVIGELSDLAIAIGNISERLKDTGQEIKLFFRALERDRPRFVKIGISEEEKKAAIATVRELQAELFRKIEPLQLTIARTRGADEGGILAQEFKFASRELEPLLELFNKLEAAVQELKGFDLLPGAKKTGPLLDKIIKTFDKLILKTQAAEKSLEGLFAGDILSAEFEVSVGKAAQILSKFSSKTIVEFAKTRDLISQSLVDAFESKDVKRSTEAYAEILRITQERFGGLIQTAKDFKTLGRIFNETRTPLEKYNLELTRLIALAEKFPRASEIISRAMNKTKRALIDASEGAQLVSRSLDTFADSTVDALTKAESAFEAFRSAMKSIVDDILNTFLRLAVTNPLKNLIFGLETGMSGAFPEIGDKGIFGGFFAHGGRPPADKISIVGEKGPELFKPDVPGTIIPLTPSTLRSRFLEKERLSQLRPGGMGPPDAPGTPTISDVTTKSVHATAIGALLGAVGIGGPLGAVTSGLFGRFGVTGGSQKPIVGTPGFSKEIEVGRMASALGAMAAGKFGRPGNVGSLGVGGGFAGGKLGGITGRAGGVGTPGAGGGFGGGMGSEPGEGGAGSVEGFAFGGRPPVGQPAVVGEFGREAFVPDNLLASNTNAPVVVVHQKFDFRGASLEAVALLKQESAKIRRETVAEIRRQNIRGMTAARR